MPFHVLLPACVPEQHNCCHYCSAVVRDVAAVQDVGCCYCYDCYCMECCCRGDEDGGAVVAVALLREREFLLWWPQTCR